MKDKEIFHKFDIMIFSFIIFTFIGFIDDAYAFFHDQDEPKTRFSEESKKNIESLFDRVNNASTNYQNDIVTLNLSINNNNNTTLVKKNQEYIDNLKKIISSAKTVTVQ